MLKKTIKVNNRGDKWTGTVIEYRFFWILIFKKELHPPSKELQDSVVYDF